MTINFDPVTLFPPLGEPLPNPARWPRSSTTGDLCDRCGAPVQACYAVAPLDLREVSDRIREESRLRGCVVLENTAHNVTIPVRRRLLCVVCSDEFRMWANAPAAQLQVEAWQRHLGSSWQLLDKWATAGRRRLIRHWLRFKEYVSG